MYNKEEVIARAAVKASEVNDDALVVPINSVHLLVDSSYSQGRAEMVEKMRKPIEEAISLMESEIPYTSEKVVRSLKEEI